MVARAVTNIYFDAELSELIFLLNRVSSSRIVPFNSLVHKYVRSAKNLSSVLDVSV